MRKAGEADYSLANQNAKERQEMRDTIDALVKAADDLLYYATTGSKVIPAAVINNVKEAIAIAKAEARS